MRKLRRDILGLTASSGTLAIGSSVVTGMGGNPAGLTTVAGFMPTMGTISGTGASLRMLNKLGKVGKRRRR